MDHLETVTVEDLQHALDRVTGRKPTQRLITAIAYKNGVTQTELAQWYGVQRRTIYNWLTRLDPDDLAGSATDDHRPGRPRRLSNEEQNKLYSLLEDSPFEAGYDAAEWTPALVQRLLRSQFDCDYSLASCRRFLGESKSA